jgi:hypothetical protein
VSVTSSVEPKGKNCEEGGSKFVATATTYACNGKEGSPWTAGGTLPSGKTETGVWGVSTHNDGFLFSAVSFNIPLKEPWQPGHLFFIQPGQTGVEHAAECPATNPAEPKAAKGDICLYAATLNHIEFQGGGEESTSGAGLTLKTNEKLPSEIEGTIPAFAHGTWAVTAE